MPIPLFGEVGSVGTAMLLTVGTFNLNNLFSRFNFEADASTAATSTVETRTTFTFDDPAGFKLRTYKGR